MIDAAALHARTSPDASWPKWSVRPHLIGFGLFTRWVWHAYRLASALRAAAPAAGRRRRARHGASVEPLAARVRYRRHRRSGTYDPRAGRGRRTRPPGAAKSGALRFHRRPRRPGAPAYRAAAVRSALVRPGGPRDRSGRHSHQPRLPGALHVLRQLRDRALVPLPVRGECDRGAQRLSPARRPSPSSPVGTTRSPRTPPARSLRRLRTISSFRSRGAPSHAPTW